MLSQEYHPGGRLFVPLKFPIVRQAPRLRNSNAESERRIAMEHVSLHRRHPYLFVGILEATVVGAFVVAGVVTRRLGMSHQALYGIGFAILTVITVILLTRMRWWKEVGFRPLGKYHLLWLPALPVLVAMFEALFGDGELLPGTALLFMLGLTAVNGFVEEVIYRGLMLRVLAARGIWRAVIITSLVFAITHSMNVLAGWNPEKVLWQLCYSFAFGFGWAAFALRTGTIWPLILIHFLNNFFSLCRPGSIVQTGSFSPVGRGIIAFYIVAFVAYGVIVTRSHVKAQGAHPEPDQAG